MDLPLEPRLSIGYQHVLAPTGYDDREGAAAGCDLPEVVRLLDSLGFDSIWSGDHVAFAGPILDPLVQLAQAAALSERLRIGTAVYLLPLRHPAPVAKQVATLDTISNGRMIFGVGVGGEFPLEYQLCGVPVEERGARLSEGIRAYCARCGRARPHPTTAASTPSPKSRSIRRRRSPVARRSGAAAAPTPRSAAQAGSRTAGCPMSSIPSATAARSRPSPPPPPPIAELDRFGTSHLLFVRLDKDRESALAFAAQVPERPLRDGFLARRRALLRAGRAGRRWRRRSGRSTRPACAIW